MTTTLLPCGPAMLSRLKLSGDLPHKINMAEITSDLAKKSGDPPSPGGGLRTISAGTTLLVHTVMNARVPANLVNRQNCENGKLRLLHNGL